MGLFKILRSIRINSYKDFFLHLNGLLLFSGSIESANHNGDIEKYEKRPDK